MAIELYLVLPNGLSMTGVLIDRERSETETLVKAAFESMDDIKQYAVEGRHIVGETGMRLTSNGERVTVEIQETNTNSFRCIVSSEKAIRTTSPQTHRNTNDGSVLASRSSVMSTTTSFNGWLNPRRRRSPPRMPF